MQNIDLLFIIQPLTILILSGVPILYWRFKRTFKWSTLLYTLIAYAVAIILKDIVQSLTLPSILESYGAGSWATGAYYGLQTVVFEVVGAYVVALYATSRCKFSAKDAEAYGLGLSFWENGFLLGILSFINMTAIYLVLSSNTPAAQNVYSQLVVSQPSLFYPASQALPLVGLGILERTSSLLVHFSWGYLCIVAAYFHKKKYFLLALPMGLIDFFVPFAQALTLPVFEALIFAFAVASLGVALISTRKLRKSPEFKT